MREIEQDANKARVLQQVGNPDLVSAPPEARIKEVRQLQSKLEALEESDAWMKQAREFQEGGGCPCCFETDEGGHISGCYIAELEEKLEYYDCGLVEFDKATATIAELEAENNDLRAELTEWQCGIMGDDKIMKAVDKLEAENKALKLKHTIEICYACSKFREVPQIVSQMKALTAELDKAKELLRYADNLPMNDAGDYDENIAWSKAVEQALELGGKE